MSYIHDTLKQNKNRYCAAKSTLETTRYKRLVVGGDPTRCGDGGGRAASLKESSVSGPTLNDAQNGEGGG